MSTPSESQSRAEEVKQLIRRELRRSKPLLRGYRVSLFGSRARGASGPRADFDVGVLGEEPIPLRAFYEIEDRLESLPTLYKIDWVDLNRAGKEFRDRALQHAETLYE